MACSNHWTLATVAFLALTACDDDASNGSDENPKSTDPDAAATTQAGAPIGALCEGRPGSCDDGECRSFGNYSTLTDGGYGFCSRSCAAPEDCPSGFRCTQTGADKICMPRCEDHPDCGTWSGLWKCAEAQGERICADPNGPRGEIVLTTRLVVERVALTGPSQAWRLVPGVWADVTVTLANKGSSGPPTGQATLYSESEWMEVQPSTTGHRVRAKEGVPIGEPQQMRVVVPDPIGTGTVEVPFFLRSLQSGLHLEPTIGIAVEGGVSVAGWITGFGTAPELTNTHNGASSDPWTASDPWLAEQPMWGTMGMLPTAASPGSSLGVTISESTGSSWNGTITVVPDVEGTMFYPDPVRRSEVEGGQIALRYVRLRDAKGPTDYAAPRYVTVQVSTDVPWVSVYPESASLWAGSESFTLEVTEPPDPGSSRAYVIVSWNGIEIGRLPLLVFPEYQ